MRIDFIFIFIPAIIILLSGVIALGIGILGFTRNHVFFINNLLFFGSMKLTYLSFLCFPAQVVLTFHPNNLAGQSLFGCICFVPILLYLLFRINRSKDDLSGYTIIGTDKTVLEAIADVLKINGISFEERHEDFCLSDLQANITTTFDPISGTVSLRMDSLIQDSVLDKVICSLKTLFSEKENYYKKVSMIQFIAYATIMAIIGFIMTVAIIFVIR
jgi:hypothetical protein